MSRAAISRCVAGARAPTAHHRLFSSTIASRSPAAAAATAAPTGDRFVKIVEVSPRDGLQNEKRVIPTETKVELIRRLANTGLKVIEAGAFVSPKWVPQMADSADVLTRLPQALSPSQHAQLSFPVLVPNTKGLESLLTLLSNPASAQSPTLTDEIAVFTAASDAFTRANTNCTMAESLERIADVIALARSSSSSASPLRVRAYVSVVLGCPFSGSVEPGIVARMTRELLDMGAYEVSLGDTIGIGTPGGVRALLDALRRESVSIGRVAAHCHDTFGTGLANVLEFVAGGVRVVDASVSGLGGCPYSPGATGNIDTESVVQALHAEGYSTGVDLLELARVGQWISDEVRGRGAASFGTSSDAESRPVNLNGSSAGRAILAREQRRREAEEKDQQRTQVEESKAKL